MPGVDGITATSRILADRPATRVLVLTTFGDDDHLYPALTAGACGFLLKDAPPGRTARRHPPGRRRGQPVQPGGAAAAGRARGARPRRRRRGRSQGLTAREQDVLDLVAEGLSNTEIADRLHIGVTTVKTHITSLMTKTDSPNRVRLALFARGV